jgi:hypothetical protein
MLVRMVKIIKREKLRMFPKPVTNYLKSKFLLWISTKLIALDKHKQK